MRRWIEERTPPAMAIGRLAALARTAGCHLALVRRVAERRPDVQLVTYQRPHIATDSGPARIARHSDLRGRRAYRDRTHPRIRWGIKAVSM
jgi:hypothetical protein